MLFWCRAGLDTGGWNVLALEFYEKTFVTLSQTNHFFFHFHLEHRFLKKILIKT